MTGNLPFSTLPPPLILAPMQDVTDLAFWRLLVRYGAPDLFVTEYIRVYPGSRIIKETEREIVENDTGRPLITQIAGEDIPSLVRIARELQHLPIAGIDLNLGCPAQVVCRKNVGGALLKNLPKVAEILAALRQATSLPLSVKCRLGYADSEHYEELLAILNTSNVDWITIHGRTVKQGYGGLADWDLIRHGARCMNCPVIGNGDISAPIAAAELLSNSEITGLMIGRSAVGNPWIFTQIRQALDGTPVIAPTGRMLLRYLYELRDITAHVGTTKGERSHVERLKKFLNFVGQGLAPNGLFLHRVRRATDWTEMESTWNDFLDHDQPLKTGSLPK